MCSRDKHDNLEPNQEETRLRSNHFGKYQCSCAEKVERHDQK